MIDETRSDSTLKTEPREADAAPQRMEARELQGLQSSSAASGSGNNEPAVGEIEALAYQFWLERGSPHGAHEEDWQRAEEQLRGRNEQPIARTAGV